MLKRLVFLVVLLLWSGCVRAESRLFTLDTFELANGLQVVSVYNPKAPIVKLMLWYKAGSMDEPIGKGGSAHLLEHLMFRGTEKISGEKFNSVLEENGAEINAFTSSDMTAYHEFMDVGRLDLALFLEADRMNGLKLTSENFSLEKDIVYQERMQVIENNPSAPFREAVQRLLWQNHPYARPVTGEALEIKNLTEKDVSDFYQRYYHPGNAVLVFSGDITAAEAKRLAERYFAQIKSSPLPPAVKFPELVKGTKGTLKMKLPQVKLPAVSKNYAVSSWKVDREQVYPLMIFSEYLGEGEVSRLHKKLVEEKKLALNISSSYNPFARSYGKFSIYAVPAAGVSAERLSAVIDEEVKKAIDEFSEEDLRAVKKRMTAGLIYLKDNPEDAAYLVGELAVLGVSPDEINKYEDNLQEVSITEVSAAAADMLENAPFAEGILLPEEEYGA